MDDPSFSSFDTAGSSASDGSGIKKLNNPDEKIQIIFFRTRLL